MGASWSNSVYAKKLRESEAKRTCSGCGKVLSSEVGKKLHERACIKPQRSFVKLDINIAADWLAYITSVSAEVVAKDRKSDVFNPDTEVEIVIKAQCMEYKPGRKTTGVFRTLTISEDGKLWWPWYNKEYVAINAEEVIQKVMASIARG